MEALKGKVLVVGGVNSDNVETGKGWAAYKAGKIVELDLINGSVSTVLYDDSRPVYIDGDKSIGTVFKAAHVGSGRAIICTTTEVREYLVKDWTLIRDLTHKKFNDVHHAIPYADDTVLVVSTGLDAVMQMTWDGRVIKSWSMDAARASMLTDPVDYRNVESTKPHAVHPNYVFKKDGHLYVTRFARKDAVCISDDSRPSLSVRHGNVHDGVRENGCVWFTSTNGWVVALDDEGNEILGVNLNDIYELDRPLGWCRGLCVLDGEHVVVGFSRLRKTKFEDNVRWVASRFGAMSPTPMPTRLAVVNFVSRKLVAEYNLEDVAGMNAVFSVHISR